MKAFILKPALFEQSTDEHLSKVRGLTVYDLVQAAERGDPVEVEFNDANAPQLAALERIGVVRIVHAKPRGFVRYGKRGKR